MSTSPAVRVWLYSNCDTCRKASKWLDAKGIARTAIPIRQAPPAVEDLRRMLELRGGDLRKLFNTSGTDYKAQGLKDRLPEMSTEEALALLAGNGNLVKRPFLLTPQGGLVGFKAGEWGELFGVEG